MVQEFGYEYDAVLNENLWKDTKGKVIREKLLGAHSLRSGRDALKAVAKEYEPCVALLPALACDSMIKPFERYGHKVRYYKLKEDFSIDINSLNLGTKKTIFLYMDYFGCRSINNEELLKIKAHGNIIFIEDRTHNLIWEKTCTFQPDYIIASLRKWLAIPDGGLLWGKISKPLESETVFSFTRLKAQCMRHEFLKFGDESLKSEYRKIFSTVADILDSSEPNAMSAYSYALAKNIDWHKIRILRKKNAEILISILSTSPYISFIQNKAGISDLYVAFTVPNRDEVQRRLSAKGVFNTIIWPLSDEQKKICPIAKFTEENMLAAPCDQRYNKTDMEFIGKEIVRVVNDVNK